MFLTIAIITLGFAAVILFLRGGLYKLDGGNLSPSADNNLSFSIIIAARNEEHNIRACLQSVFAQDLGDGRYEVIVIDDRSEDSTPDILRELVDRHQNLRIITITETPPGTSPKKHAVSMGIKSASNDIIVFTDADCRVPPQWLSTINRYFDDDTALVQGITSYSYIDGMSKALYDFQSIDFLSHGIIAAAAIGANLPINSNANNMAFRKKVFDDIGGYGEEKKGVTLGDDDHLLQRVWLDGKKKCGMRNAECGINDTGISTSGNEHRIHPRGIRFMVDPRGSVETAPTETVPALFEQRRRWGSVTVHYGIRQVILLSMVFLFYLTIPFTLIASIFNITFLPICASLLLVKLCGELVLMIPGTRMFGKKRLRKYIIPASLIQLPLVLLAVVSGVFGRFDWKGRKMGRKVNT